MEHWREMGKITLFYDDNHMQDISIWLTGDSLASIFSRGIYSQILYLFM